ncbi:large subunit ribosomal protein L10 [Metamycoplasma subdolum]|uniref:Large ribosomal subunit protein uL10 n=1 Tax=Metamycoplasma subdolum TaxID=92407 RepID=A0A3M0A270_9BACT|nr:50S ribosomal protein L10 [Metamycoplasma subdolum]RMA77559.1 large subunit ribosomal protein L10 [Metamycoplasma subdolum]WPB50353.1 50S ribosomal protein L10 [Metamycoplasma subdolum]
MSALRDAKGLVVKEISDHLNQSKALYVLNYKTLDVKALQQIRNVVAGEGVLLKVYKNRLVKLAADSLKFGDINASLIGQNIYAFAKQDDLNALKAIVKNKKQFPALELVAGIYENKVVNAKELEEIAKLPSYEEALMILGNSLISPIRNIAIGLNMLIEQGKVKAE